jgi:hypothetical protein
MPLTVLTAPKLSIHVGYGYLLLDPTPENLELAKQLLEAPHYTTVYDAELKRTVYVRRDGERKVSEACELANISVCDVSECDYRAATAEPAEPET